MNKRQLLELALSYKRKDEGGKWALHYKVKDLIDKAKGNG